MLRFYFHYWLLYFNSFAFSQTTPRPIPQVEAHLYDGCYENTLGYQLWHGPVSTSMRPLTPQICLDSCYKNKYRFSGVQDGYACYCGNFEISQNKKKPETECNLKCRGDRRYICGGQKRINVYRTNYNEALKSYLGCYITHQGNLLNGMVTSALKPTNPNTCSKFCAMHRFKYTGVLFASWCHCGNELVSITLKQDETECDMKCTGTGDKPCGGLHRMSIYKTDLGKVLGEHFGCFESLNQENILKGTQLDTIYPLSPGSCANQCYKEDYTYAGLANGNLCFCGSYDPPANKMKPLDECDKKCDGNYKETCGGLDTVEIYKIFHGNLLGDHIGCFQDGKEKILKGTMFRSLFPLTPKICTNICYKYGFTFAGLSNGDTCVCGNENVDKAFKKSKSKCNKECMGSPAQHCGGEEYLDIYESGYGLSTWEYLGCFEGHILKRKVIDSISPLSPKICSELCYELGFTIAGVENGHDCFCDNDQVDQTKKKNETNCNHKCTGNSREVCGGEGHLSVYQYGQGDVLYEYYVGCYEKLTFTKDIKNLLPLSSQSCINECYENGFKFAGLRQGTMCSCTNKEITNQLKTSEDHCDKTCNGNNKEVCGSQDHTNVYETGYGSELGEYLGCFVNDDQPSLVNDRVITQINPLNPVRCSEICFRTGYKYAGLQYGHTCYCGNKDISLMKKVMESECDKKCVGRPIEFCGGEFHMNIFRADPDDIQNYCT